MLKVTIQKRYSDTELPKQHNWWAAWYDVYSYETLELQPGERHAFKSWISIVFEKGYYCRVAPRSWLAYRNWIDVLAWVIDHDYTWEYLIILINLGEEAYTVTKWDRIAQLIFEKCHAVEFFEVKDLWEHERWWNGIGSSGK